MEHEEAPAGMAEEAATHEIPALPGAEEVAAGAAEADAHAAEAAAAEATAAEDKKDEGEQPGRRKPGTLSQEGQGSETRRRKGRRPHKGARRDSPALASATRAAK